MQEPQKFGFHDKSEITEQMKLYSIWIISLDLGFF